MEVDVTDLDLRELRRKVMGAVGVPVVFMSDEQVALLASAIASAGKVASVQGSPPSVRENATQLLQFLRSQQAQVVPPDDDLAEHEEALYRITVDGQADEAYLLDRTGRHVTTLTHAERSTRGEFIAWVAEALIHDVRMISGYDPDETRDDVVRYLGQKTFAVKP